MKISYVITVYNKAPYILDVIKCLAAENSIQPEAVEYIFVDDGSSDESVDLINEHGHLLRSGFTVIEQENQGAAVATNVGTSAAQYEWIRLLDGDDIPCRDSTRVMYEIATENKVDFVIGSFGYFSQSEAPTNQMGETNRNNYVVMNRKQSQEHFIKSFPHNSSCMLIKKSLFEKFGGADTRLRSPDYTIALRATAMTEKISLITENVAMMVQEAPGRLSSQIARSRYDSICAIYYFAHELLPNEHDVAIAVYKRSCSRAYRYARKLGNSPFKHFIRYIYSKIFIPSDLKKATYNCLSAFTPNESPERPPEWTPRIQNNQ